MPVPFVDMNESHAVHFPVGQFPGARRMPFLVPADGFLAFLNNFFETPSLGKTVFLLVTGDPIPVVSVAAVILQSDFGRIQSHLGGDAIEHHVVRARRCGSHAGNTWHDLY